MQDTFARATHSAARPSARATIGYLVYNTIMSTNIFSTIEKIKYLEKLLSILSFKVDNQLSQSFIVSYTTTSKLIQ